MPSPDVLHLLYGGLGGQHRLVLDLAAGFAQRGLTTTAIAYGPEAELLVDPNDWPSVDRVHFVPKERRFDARGTRQIRRIVEDSAPRAMVWHSAYGVRAVRLALQRHVVKAVVLVEHQSVALRRLPQHVRSFQGVRAASRTVVLSEDARANHPLRFVQARRLREAVVITNGVDLATFHPAERPSRPFGAPLRLITVGRLVTSRDTETAIRGLAEIARRGIAATLTVVGDGPERLALERTARDIGVDRYVTFVGRIAAARVAEHLRAADIYLHPSLGEGRSTALLQAWASGLPVVAASVRGIEDAIRAEVDGILVPASSPQSMADAVVRVARDASLAANLGLFGRRRAETDFPASACVASYLGLLAEIDPRGPWNHRTAA